MLGESPPPLLPTFRFACTTRMNVLAMMLRDLQANGLRIDEALLQAEVDLYNGDLVALGRGEIFLRPRNVA
jgi:hypothetical protein